MIAPVTEKSKMDTKKQQRILQAVLNLGWHEGKPDKQQKLKNYLKKQQR